MAYRILIIGPAWVGDMVLAQSLFKALKQTRPDCVIDVAAPAWTLPVLKRMAEVDQAIALPFAHGELALRQRRQIGLSWRQHGYQQAILLVNSFKSALAPWFANIPVRTGFRGEMRYGLLNDRRHLDTTRLPRTVDRFVSLAVPADQALPSISNPSLQVDAERVQALITQWQIDTQQPILGLCPGAEYGAAKRWPAEYYAELAQHALAKGWQVFLFGSAKDQAVTQTIQALTQQACRDFAGQTSLTDVIDMLSLCRQVVSNDSGLMHIAAALNIPMVALYGSSDPQHTPPMSAQAVIEYLGLGCSPCFQRDCPLQHTHCLTQISPARVQQRLSALAHAPTSRSHHGAI